VRLHLVDGTYELFRAFFSKRPSHTAGGRDVKATVAFASAMIALLHDAGEAVTHVAVAFDNPIRSFRNDLFDGYKTEHGVPPELLAQFDDVEAAARALGMTVWSMDRWEADDAMATGAARYARQVEQVRILTPDKDLGQSVQGTHVVQVDRMRGKLIDEDAVRAVRGVGPAQIPDWLALVGDAADGIPGIPGFGEKTSAAVLAAHGHLEDIPAKGADWKVRPRGADALADVLAARRDDAFLYRRLATLVTDVPLTESLGDLAFAGVPRDGFGAFCDRFEVKDLAPRVGRWR